MHEFEFIKSTKFKRQKIILVISCVVGNEHPYMSVSMVKANDIWKYHRTRTRPYCYDYLLNETDGNFIIYYYKEKKETTLKEWLKAQKT